jgi:hypothetical protein
MHDSERLWPQLIAALLSERTLEGAASMVGLARSTVQQLLRDPDFAEMYRQARLDLMERVSARLLHLCDRATDTLAKALSNKKASTTAKIKAATAILDRAMRAHELLDLEGRLRLLEARLEGKNDECCKSPAPYRPTGS